jgi:hypothetical protein
VTLRAVACTGRLAKHAQSPKSLDLKDGLCATGRVKIETNPQRSDAPGTISIAIRPTLLFVAAFALNVTPHEAAHAVAAYLLGFSSTLFQMWVDPDAETASSRQVVAIATAGPIFSLAVGGITWLLYKFRYNRSRAGLVFLMLAVVGIYSFLGPVTGAAFGGDFNIVLRSAGASEIIQYATSATGLVLLPVFMFFMGKELSRWAPLSFGRAKAVVCTTVAPWLIGTLLVLLVYWPLPRFLVGPTLIGSSFWLFAVFGAAYGFSNTRTADLATSVTRSDLIITAFALIMVRMLVHGVRLAH